MSPAASSKKSKAKPKAKPAAAPARQVYVEKPPSDVYTGVLWASLVCITLACLFLAMEWWALSPQT